MLKQEQKSIQQSTWWFWKSSNIQYQVNTLKSETPWPVNINQQLLETKEKLLSVGNNGCRRVHNSWQTATTSRSPKTMNIPPHCEERVRWRQLMVISTVFVFLSEITCRHYFEKRKRKEDHPLHWSLKIRIEEAAVKRWLVVPVLLLWPTFSV